MMTYISRLFTKKEQHMAKKSIVKFNRADAPLPRKFENGVLGLRAPMPITVKAHSTTHLDFGLTCNYPIIVVGGLVSSDRVVFAANQKIECTLTNNFRDDAIFEVGSTIVHIIPLLAPDYDLE